MTTFTIVHVVLSLAGIISGFVVVSGLIAAQRLDRWTLLFLATTAATSLTGFGFPFEHVLPSHVVGAISLLVLVVAIVARYGRHLVGAWRWMYVVGAVVALYLNVFVLIVQLFLKVPALKAIAPTQSEPPFVVAQLALLAVFIALGVVTVRRFHERLVRTAWAEHGTLSIRAGRTRRLHRKAEKAAMNTRPDYDQKRLSRCA